jgi:hypothetical protein
VIVAVLWNNSKSKSKVNQALHFAYKVAVPSELVYKTKSQIFQILEAAVAVPPISITARPGVPLFHINALI